MSPTYTSLRKLYESNPLYMQLLRGNTWVRLPPRHFVVRGFPSSTFTGQSGG
jgi:hypothetical protein